MTDIDLLYYELKKTKIKLNVTRVVTLVLVFVPFIIGYKYGYYVALDICFNSNCHNYSCRNSNFKKILTN